ncbi:hypothetical protein B9Z55_007372 [Caenorhabditis nigoni]|uniref:Uncharacterized protein n=1 Tax=Caenorhabditis nigoni TaxID=1611254 RepID=A0A2G5V9Q2_9PELO|nr:hypothetical protein B9Z55_007372 [Caenorhabditis nigoni]
METTSSQAIYRPIPIYGVSPVGMTPQGMARLIVLIGGDEPSAFKPYCAPKSTPNEYFIALVAASNNTIYGILPIGRAQGMASKIVMIGGDGPSAFQPYCAPDKKKGEPLSVDWDPSKMSSATSKPTASPLPTPQVAASPEACSFRPLMFRTQKELNVYRSSRTSFFNAFAAPEPLDPTTPEYQDRLAEAKKNASSSSVYQDDKILLRSSLFNPDLDAVIPQEVKSSADSANLFSTWFMKKEGVDRVASRVTWSRIVSEKGDEWREWTTRAEELKNEHKKQLMCGYVKLASTKNRKRKMEASVGSQQLSNKKC